MRDEYDFEDGVQGRVKQADGSVKLPITIRLDGKIIEYFKKKAGPNGSYQKLINQALLDHMHNSNIKDDIRTIIREELQHSK